MADDEKLLENLRWVTGELRQAHRRVRELEADAHEPIAIIGMGCRYPGGIETPDQLWDFVASGADAVGSFPADRGWDLQSLYNPDPDHTGTSYSDQGGFLRGAGDFDAGLFGISPREALAMDPQQRLLLEVSWEAFERAGIDVSTLHRSPTGVFVGTAGQDYASILRDPPEGVEGYVLTGTAASVISGRLAYTFGFEGPAITLDTACSSSLVALHLASQALRKGECSLAIAGGVTVMATPGAFVEFSRQRGLASDGRCKSFAAAADGTGWSEGAGVVIVERLRDAQRLGHPILAVVRGSAVNQDGASSGLTAPNGPSQQRVIQQALADAGLTTAEVDAVEAHGTGTRLGDPIEAQAILATYGSDRPSGQPLWLGSIKSNIGHTQAAAGVAGVIKMVMALRHGVLPRTLHAEEQSPHVDWRAGAVSLLNEEVPWPAADKPRRAAVSSFGMSGTNAHAIVEEAPQPPTVADAPAPAVELPVTPVLISGADERALAGQAERWARWLRGGVEADLADVGWSSVVSRSVLEHRAVVLASDRDGLIEGLDQVAAGVGLVTGVAAAGRRVGVLFSGQGAQRVGMGAGLYGVFPVFTQVFDEVCAGFDGLLPQGLKEVLFGDSSVDETQFAQAGLFAVEVALWEQLSAWGVRPEVVGGHSIGELVAAYVAGVWSLPDACVVVAARGRLMQALPSGGAMLAVAAPVSGLLPDGVSVAAVNGPSSVVLSGPAEAIDALQQQWTEAGVRTSRVRVSHAFHSALMEPMLERFREALSTVTFQVPRLPVVSNVTGQVADPAALQTAGYWVEHIRGTVRFADNVAAMRDAGVDTFVELGPDAILTPHLHTILGADDEAVVVGSLRRGRDEPESLLRAAAELFVAGVNIDWPAVFGAGGRRAVALPTYAFQRERFWLESAGGVGDVSGAGLRVAGHPLLAAVVRLAGDGVVVVTGRLSLAAQPWLADHVVGGVVVLPGAALVEMVVRAGDEVGATVLDELTLVVPLVVPATSGVVVQVRVGDADERGRRPVTVFSRLDDGDDSGDWTRHADGVLDAPGSVDATESWGVWPPAGVVEVPVGDWYAQLASSGGVAYGPVFRGLRRVWRGDEGVVFAEVGLSGAAADAAGSFGVHPALLDAALHSIGFLDHTAAGPVDGAWLPFEFGGVRVHAAGAKVLRVRISGDVSSGVEVLGADESGQLVVSIDRVVLRELTADLTADRSAAKWLYELAWQPRPVTSTAPAADWVLLDVPAVDSDGMPVVVGGAVVGADGMVVVGGAVMGAGGVRVVSWAGLRDLVEAGSGPSVVVWRLPSSTSDAGPDMVGGLAGVVLRVVRQWLGLVDGGPGRLVVVTQGAVAAGGNRVTDLAAAAIWGLLRVAASEHPDRFVLVDADGEVSVDVLAGVVGAGLGEVAVRGGVVLAPALTRVGGGLALPGGLWRLAGLGAGTVEGVGLVGYGRVPLGAGEVRIAVRAAGLNFRDVLIALGVYPDPDAVMGSEAAGVVVEVGGGVTDLVVGDRVMGVFDAAVGVEAVADRDRVVRVPAGWSFVRAASVPVVFLTAYYGLRDVAGLSAGESVLIHSGAGGVGMAAIQLARHWGARVYATASPSKWPVVAGLGVEEGRIASSRTTDFEGVFLRESGGVGVDVVLDALAGEFVDASLRLLPRGGRFVEMGKADLRDPAVVAEQYPGVVYEAFDLGRVSGPRIGEMLADIVDLFERGVLRPLPVHAFDVRRTPDALRMLSQARHVGKLVLTVPRGWDPQGTVLITGGGVLAGVIARHLAVSGTVAHVMIASRQGEQAAGHAALVADLEAAGVVVTVVACDVRNRDAVFALVESVPVEYPLTAVVHTAGVIADTVIESMTADQLDMVLGPKVDGGWYLHEATAGLDLAGFVMFSSVAATLGSPGQGNYAAANAFLDALAHFRQQQGLPATSLAWGLWAQASTMTAGLDVGVQGRLSSGGMVALESAQGAALFDAGVRSGQPMLVAARLEAPRPGTAVPGMLRELFGAARPRALAGQATGASLPGRLAGLGQADAARLVVEAVCVQAGMVLGHATGSGIAPTRAFKDLGFDSLTSVELRNRLATLTGLRLPATLVFDYPTPHRLAGYILTELHYTPADSTPAPPVLAAVDDDPVVIISMACRFPGAVATPDQLWDLVHNGVDAIGGFPADRGWDLDRLHNADPDHSGTSYTRHGGFLHAAAMFDNTFFGISPREALAMDPQQRLLLETTWEAYENAGINPTTQTGTFIGASSSNYASGAGEQQASLDGHLLTGTAGSVASGRLAYVFGLEGPAVTVDTACSSSLVALHLAAQSLRQGECNLAIAAGAAVMSTPGMFTEFSRQGGLSVDGRCKSFAGAADGTGWSEGVGVLLLERLSDARRLGHPILAVVRGSAVNQDGASNGLTAPNGPAQQRVIRQALASAGLAPSDVDTVEAHGTGTVLGDPIEAQAVLATYGQDRPADRPLWLGSIKSNIGHAQAAAGAAGIIKMIMALRHETLPRTLHVDEPTPHVDWSAGAVSLLTEARPWPADGRPRRAGVSSFGISGTNAHIIIEEPPPVPPSSPAAAGDHTLTGLVPSVVALLVSGKGATAMRAQAAQLHAMLVERPELELVDVGFSLATARAPHSHRSALVVRSRAEAVEALAQLAADQPGANLPGVTVDSAAPIVFVFPGQGSQWTGMAVDLLDSSPVFRQRLTECAEALSAHVDWALEDVLRGLPGAPSLDRVDVVQPALFAVMVSLAAVWQACGVQPDVVVGHSQGEIAAACVAGALSLADAARIVVVRSRSLVALAGQGGMVAVSLSSEDATQLIGPWDDELSIAAINGSASTVVSGGLDALAQLETACAEQAIRFRRLPVDYAAHSHQIEAVRHELLAAFASVEPRSSKVAFYSTVSAELIDTADLDADYWYENLRQPVRLQPVISRLIDADHRVFVEVSPHPVLKTSIQEELDAVVSDDPAAGLVVGSLRRDEDGARELVSNAAQLFVAGVDVDWPAVFDGSGGRVVALPTYPFQRERFWLEPAGAVGDVSGAGLGVVGHPLLGAVVRMAQDGVVVVTGRLSLAAQPWLADHVVGGVVVLPGAALVEMVVRAGDEVGATVLDELTLVAPLVVPATSGVVVQVRVGETDEDGRRPVTVFSRLDDGDDSGDWIRHADGVLDAPGSVDVPESWGVWPPAGVVELPVGDWYPQLAASGGVAYGPVFQGLRRVWRGEEGVVFAEVGLSGAAADAAGSFGVHPALLDAALHPIGFLDQDGAAGEGAWLPFEFGGVRVHAAGAKVLRVRISGDVSTGIAIVATDESGQLVVSIDRVVLRELTTDLAADRTAARWLYELAWQPRPVTSAAPAADWVLLDVPAVDSDAVAVVGGGVVDADGVAVVSGAGGVRVVVSWAGLRGLVEAGSGPSVVVWRLPSEAQVGGLAGVVLNVAQQWLGLVDGGPGRLVVVTRGAVAAHGSRVTNLAAAAVWGLLRVAASEHPDRFVLVDVEGKVSADLLAGVVGAGLSEAAVRGDVVLAPGLTRAGGLAPPGGLWRLAGLGAGTVEGVGLVGYARGGLGVGEVRIAVRAAGLNFRDVLIALGVYPDPDAVMGSEAAGVVLEVGAGVTDLVVGDRVMGVFDAAVGPEAVADRDRVARIPAGWSFVRAASVPVVFLTAYYGLRDVAGLSAGESVLIHSGAGGVGMAAIQLAHHWGAQVYATASPSKWPVVAALGVEEGRIASSRTTDFEEAFLAESGGAGVDVVLDALAGEFVDASLRLLPRGGRFVEMGKADVRDPAAVADQCPGVRYEAFDLGRVAGPRVGQMLADIVDLFEQGVLQPLPVHAFDVRRAPDALRMLSQARHVGKLVLTVPRRWDANGTVLITGGGALAGVIARHLAASRTVAHIMIASRHGAQAAGHEALVVDLEAAGVAASAVACDVRDRDAVFALVESVPAEHPLTAVVHTAGVIADTLIESMTADQLDMVLGPKVDGGWHLHEATAGLDLAGFVMFSSIAATLGSPGQGNYAAANAYLDALAHYRQQQGLPATSLAWGLWAQTSTMTAHVSGRAVAGSPAITDEQGAALFDAAHGRSAPHLVLLPLTAKRTATPDEQIPPLLRDLVRGRGARRKMAVTGGDTASVRHQLASLTADERRGRLTEMVAASAASVLGFTSTEILQPHRPFKDVGFDSLTSVELRNRLSTATGLRLPTTLAFDYPTPAALAAHLDREILGEPLDEPTLPGSNSVATADEQIAIVGMSCRFPGAVWSPDDLWDLVSSGADAIGDFPTDRGWGVDAVGGAEHDGVATRIRQGGFLHDAADFDAEFFGINPREALAMDPQQRILLESAWEAIERGGIDPTTMRGSRTGVFVGLIYHDYASRASNASGELDGYIGNGSAGSIASGRIAYNFGFEGPAVTVDTACSSSLVALHLAAQSLRHNECEFALVGGVTVMSTPGMLAEFASQGGLSPDGRCKAFGSGAQGTGFAEGVGMLLVERLSDALRHGHPVLAVVRGSAINQDGASSGLTAPNGPSQQRVIRQALANAGLSPADVDAVEAHGTGTTLGDPIEAQALLATYGRNRPADRPLYLGSVKSNIGHAQAAAGVAGIIKMVMAMRHGVLPKTLHVDEPTTHVDWTSGAVSLLTEHQPWLQNGHPRRAGVSSFGISGTNAHVIIEAPPAPADAEDGGNELAMVPLVLSARTAVAVRASAGRLAGFLDVHPPQRLTDVGYSLIAARATFEHRAVLIAADRDGAMSGLAGLAAGDPGAGLVVGVAAAGRRVGVLFSGQGAQRLGMGAGLYGVYPVFTQVFDEVCAGFDGLLPKALKDVLFADASVDETQFAQAGLFAVEVALWEQLRVWGVRPEVVGGHSIGELVAAYVAGVWSLPDACVVVAARGRLMQALPSGGAMLAVAAPVSGVLPDGVSVAAVNGPSSVVLSGPVAAIDALQREWTEAGVRTSRVRVSHAFHSALMEPMLEQFREVLSTVTFQVPRLPVVSNVTGQVADPAALQTAEYWVEHIRGTVRFADNVAAMRDAGVDTFVELGPDAILTPHLHSILGADDEAVVVGSLRRGRDEPESLLRAAAELFVAGVDVNWPAVFGTSGGPVVSLPTYAFQRERFWLESAADIGDVSGAGLGVVGHPLLGAVVRMAGDGVVVVTGRLSLAAQPWLGEHVVGGVVVVPGTALVEMVVRAGDEVGATVLDELLLVAPLTVPASGGVQVQVRVGDVDERGRRPVTVFSRPADDTADWTRHADGILDTPQVLADGLDGWTVWPPAGVVEVPVGDWYARTAASGGVAYGPVFQGVRRIWRGAAGEVFAEVALSGTAADAAGSFGVHPALLDAALHPIGFLDHTAAGPVDGAWLPFEFGGVRVHAAGAKVLRVRVRGAVSTGIEVLGADESGQLVVSIDRVVLRELTADLTADRSAAKWLYELAWQPRPVTSSAHAADWVVLDVPAVDADGMPVVVGGAVVDADGMAVVGGAVMGAGGVRVVSWAGLRDLVEAGSGPSVVVWRLPSEAQVGGLAGVVLRVVRQWLGLVDGGPGRLVVVTQGAVAAGGNRVTDLAAAAIWGLLRVAASEHPDRFVLVDADGEVSVDVLAGVVGAGLGEVAMRGDVVLAPALMRTGGLALPGGLWRLAGLGAGTVEGVGLVGYGRVPLGAGEVRIAVRAAGLNFRDVLIALGVYPDPDAVMGSEAAGVVVEVGGGVTDLVVGDRVMGVFDAAVGVEAVADRDRVVRVPAGWSFVRAASVPVVFLTAYYGLRDVAGLSAGESVLIHSGAGGVGMAAIQLARHWGARVYATASPSKWPVVAGLGVEEGRIASSRTTDFEGVFLRESGGVGVDVVLDALAGEFVDASLRLLPRGGRFVEMGKADLRDPAVVAEQYPGVVYEAFDLGRVSGPRIGEMLADIVDLFERGVLRPLPVHAFDVRRTPDALRMLSQARHVGKLVLTVPRGWDPQGTVLITGGGVLAGVIARHLAASRTVAHVMIASRQGEQAAGHAALVADLEAAGVAVTVVACDVRNRDAVFALVESVPPQYPLTAVVHTAGVIADTVIESMTADQLDMVLGPKVDGGWYLHEATAGLDLAGFVMFSSVAATLGSPGQGNYAAANAFLDALAHFRQQQGLPATSLAWGLWAQASTMTAGLDVGVQGRLSSGGMVALESAQGAALFDAGVRSGQPMLVAARLEAPRPGTAVPGMLRELFGAARPRALAGQATGASLPGRLAGLGQADAARLVVEAVCVQAGMVLGHATGSGIAPTRAFKDLGFDSLTSVELRNRLATLTGLRLPATLVFDYPTPHRLAGYILDQLHHGGVSQPALATTGGTARVADDPIVIISMACRFPGAVATPEQLWDLVHNGVDAIGGFPADRGWDLDRLHNADPDHSGTSYTRHGGFLHAAAMFDNTFFGISPREALAMDPQQRLLLETTWEAYENAGINPTTQTSSQTGAFFGLIHHDYVTQLAGSSAEVEGYVANGSAGSVASGRVAYVFGLEGPAVTVDTACSSSLVALHLAAQSLRQGECDLALAGGVTVMATPGAFVEFSRQRGLSTDGRCKSFAGAADGTGWSEGVGVLLVERMSDAVRLGHPILAVVAGSAVNQDGASNGLTAPNGPSQQRVIRQALASAGLSPSDVDVVEAHGTGTTLGDPIEAQALLATYGQDRSADRPLWLGSIKSNIGHTQAAAGAAGIMKMIMAMRHETLPKTLHVDEPTPHVDWSAGGVALLTEPRPWLENGRPRRAGVSSFGISGTNAHVILEAPPTPTLTSRADEAALAPLVVSAHTGAALRAAAGRLATFLTAHSDERLTDVGHSLITARARFEHRAVLLASDRDVAIAGLAGLADGDPGAGVVTGVAGPPRRVGVLFSGQGAQRAGMGAGLYGVYPVFTQVFDEVCAGFDGLLPRLLQDVLFADALVDDTQYAQAGLFAIEVALFEQLRAWGLRPEVVGGHSIGELVAAYVAGVWSLPDACAVVAARGTLMQALPAGGAMLAVAAPVSGALPDGVSVAAVNGPSAVVLSGPAEAIDELERQWTAADVRTSRVRVSHAFHSALMEPMLAPFRDALAGVKFLAPQLPVLSNVTGDLADPAALQTAEYWVEHIRGTVRFADNVATMRGTGLDTFLELGPDTILTPHLHAVLGADEGVVVVGSLRRGQDEPESLLRAAAELFVSGVDIDWSAVLGAAGHRIVALPTYAFQGQRFWPEPAPAVAADPDDTSFWSAVDRSDITELVAQLGEHTRTSLDTLVPALSSWRHNRTRDRAIDTWSYRIEWTPLPTPPRPTLTGRWLIVAAGGNATDVATDVATELRESGATVDVTTMESVDADPTALVDLTGVVLVVPERDEELPDHPGISTGAASLLSLLRQLTAADSPARLWCVTHGAVAVSANEPVVGGRSNVIWGLGRVIGLEQPNRWGGLIDLPAGDGRATGIAGILADGSEDQIAVRGSGVFGRRLSRATLASDQRWTPTGTVLITGGTGALGARVARWVLTHGADRVMLLSRQGRNAPGAEDLIAGLSALGEVEILQCDIADREALARVVDPIVDLTAVVHTAGVSGTTVAVADLSPAELASVLGPKSVGATNLDAVTRDRELDAFVLFGSIAGTWGSAGQGAYSAANAALDGLVADRRSRGLSGTCVSWGPWADGGMATAEAQQHLSRRGLAAMNPDIAIAALGQAVGRDLSTVTVVDVNWEQFAPAFASARPRPLLLGIPEAAAALAALAGDAHVSTELYDKLLGLGRVEQDRLLTDLVRGHAAAVLGHTATDAVDAHRPFKELGFDSLTAIDLRNRLTAATSLSLPTTLIFDHPNPAILATHLREQLLDESDRDQRADPAEVELRRVLASIPIARFREAGLLDLVLQLGVNDGPAVDTTSGDGDLIDEMDTDTLVRLALESAES